MTKTRSVEVVRADVIAVAPSYREPDPAIETIYLCYDENAPLPFDKSFFMVKDRCNRQWSCHELEIEELSREAATKIANTIADEYTPKTESQTLKCAKAPILLKAAAVRALDEEELQKLLGDIPLQWSSR